MTTIFGLEEISIPTIEEDFLNDLSKLGAGHGRDPRPGYRCYCLMISWFKLLFTFL